jgi:hypothetical protein
VSAVAAEGVEVGEWRWQAPTPMAHSSVCGPWSLPVFETTRLLGRLNIQPIEQGGAKHRRDGARDVPSRPQALTDLRRARSAIGSRKITRAAAFCVRERSRLGAGPLAT